MPHNVIQTTLGRKNLNAPMYENRFENSLHKFQEKITIWISELPCEASWLHRGFTSFTFIQSTKIRTTRWNLWILVKARKVHTETLWINQLSIRDTCEGYFRYFFGICVNLETNDLFISSENSTMCHSDDRREEESRVLPLYVIEILR